MVFTETSPKPRVLVENRASTRTVGVGARLCFATAVPVQKEFPGANCQTSWVNRGPHSIHWWWWSCSLLNGHDWRDTPFSDRPIWWWLNQVIISLSAKVERYLTSNGWISWGISSYGLSSQYLQKNETNQSWTPKFGTCVRVFGPGSHCKLKTLAEKRSLTDSQEPHRNLIFL